MNTPTKVMWFGYAMFGIGLLCLGLWIYNHPSQPKPILEPAECVLILEDLNGDFQLKIPFRAYTRFTNYYRLHCHTNGMGAINSYDLHFYLPPFIPNKP